MSQVPSTSFGLGCFWFNRLAYADTQHHKAASRRLLHAGHQCKFSVVSENKTHDALQLANKCMDLRKSYVATIKA